MMQGSNHQPVLVDQVLAYLAAERPGLYLDCTLGIGGHSLAILKHNPQAQIIGFDIDESSLLEAQKKLMPFAERVELIHSDFRYIPDLKLDFPRIKGVLLDLGLSSFQLDNPARGFSYQLEGPLDMRMDTRNKLTAWKIIHKYSEKQLADIFWKFGELRQSKKLARAIVSRRKRIKLETTRDLLRIVEEICRWRPQKGKIHPAAKVFQALRIEVNQELKGLDYFLERLTLLLKPGARIVVISFHSLEDRIIKQSFNHLARTFEPQPLLRVLTKKPITPEEKEVAANFRARSAKLRAAERI